MTDRDGGYAGSHALLDAFQLPRVTRHGESAVQCMAQISALQIQVNTAGPSYLLNTDE